MANSHPDCFLANETKSASPSEIIFSVKTIIKYRGVPIEGRSCLTPSYFFRLENSPKQQGVSATFCV